MSHPSAGRSLGSLSFKLGVALALVVLATVSLVSLYAYVLNQESLPMHRAGARTLLVGLVTALAGFLAAFALGRRLLGPIHRLAEAMGRFGAGDASARAPVLDQDERGRLARSFNAMADALQVHQDHLEGLVLARTQELTLSERHYRELTHAVPVGIFNLDADGKLRFANDQWYELTGLHGFKGGLEQFEQRILPEDRAQCRVATRRAFANREPAETAFRLMRPDGRVGWVSSRMVPEFDEAQVMTGVIGTLQDIDQRKETERHQQELEAQLEQARKMESLGILVAGVAHNINNVLAIVMGTASLREQLALEPADREAYLTIGKVCRRGREVVKSMIHFAQPTLAAQAPFELHGLIGEVCALMKSTTRPGVAISTALAGEPLWLSGDAGSINHALVNLCLNSVDAMPEGGTITFRTTILDEDRVEVSVEDSGAGMAPEVLAHALEPFFTTKLVGEGTGLGLSVAYGVVTAHGGTIAIASRPGQGTAVRLRFPRIAAPAAGEPAPLPPASLGALNVFLVDDEEDVRFLMTRMLKKAGVRQVRTFAGGEAALEALRSGEPPDLIILDQNMPGLDGVQTMNRIRALYPLLPILISSGQPDIEDRAEFKRPRVSVISKPFTMEEIQARLEGFV